MAKHLYTFINPTSKKHLEKASELLNKDGIIAYPTDVNWALGCNASSPKALSRLQALKPFHPKAQPFSLLCDSLSMVAQVANVSDVAFRVLRKILPGPYTLLLESNKMLPRQIKDKRKTVGVRVPQSPLILDLINCFGGPLLTTSISQYEISKDNFVSIRYGYELDEHLGHGLDLILDLGEEVVPLETTIIDMTQSQLELVRQGVGAFEL